MRSYSHSTAAGLVLAIALFSSNHSVAQDTTLIVGEPVIIPGAEFAMSATAADVDGDELPDLIVGLNFGSPIIFLNNGTATPFADVDGQSLPSDTQQQAYVADLNNDGHLDIIAMGFNVPTKLYLNNGSSNPFVGVTGSDVNPGSIDSSTAVAVADLNADGFPDLALANTNHYVNRVILNNGTAQPFDGSAVLNIGDENAYANDIVLADVNGDQLPDAFVAFDLEIADEPAGVYMYLNNGTDDPFGNVEPVSLYPNNGAWSLRIADFNQDDRPDIAIGGEVGGNAILLHTGSNTQPYEEPLPLATPEIDTACIAASIADINSDSFPDLALGCGYVWDDPSSTALGAIFLNNGTDNPFNGVNAVDIPVRPGSDWNRSIELVDLTGTGEMSLLTAEGSPRYMRLHYDQNPIANDDYFAGSVGNSIEADVLANDSDADGALDRSTLTITREPSDGTVRIEEATQTILYEPEAGFIGDDSIEYTVTDDQGAISRTASVEFHVQGIPVAFGDVATTRAGTAVIIDVLANDSVEGGTLSDSSLTITSAAAHGTASIVAGSFVIQYQPQPGFVGTDLIQYSVSDNLGLVSAPATVTIAVNAAPATSPPPAGGGGGGGGGSSGLLGILLLSILASFRMSTHRRENQRGQIGQINFSSPTW